MLIHWPGTKRLKHSDPKNATNRRETLRAMETYLASGQIRNIGVSNYFAQHLDDQTLSKIKVNQIEFHPFLWTERTQQLLALCRKNGVHVTAYSPLGQAQFMQNESIRKLATMANVSPAQLMLNWAVSKGCSIIPKTSTLARLKENMDAVNMDIADEILKSVDNIVSIYGEKRVCWDPSTVV
jgi:diketogulonate reductase-like aldo/keto reductase